jgi:hypothetical protein
MVEIIADFSNSNPTLNIQRTDPDETTKDATCAVQTSREDCGEGEVLV